MTPLSEALTAAQRSALAALEKAYVAGSVEQDELVQAMEACGLTDPVDITFLVASLDVLREWGVAAPTMGERITEAKVEPASDRQWTLILDLAQRNNVQPPNAKLTKAQASQVIDELQKGTYDPAKYSVPF